MTRANGRGAGIPIRSERAVEPEETLYEERTELAWNRSGLALLAAFAILARRVWSDDTSLSDDTLAVALLAVACLGWAVGTLGWRLVHHTADEPRPRAPRELFAVALGTVALAAAGLVIAFADV
jgi:uncharacterized membrane protein YidH (DUF202 family)